ncbi:MULTISPECIES: BTAD domain-containing putative transcriptional regulator [unclassified Pseudofrankia]|uniref:BTAD domain-containing putative transcriptional regulator n=1 Tax=unclassified Pseudofrankia TaxID=2994372 RepID=UPI0008D8E046|nr:MULTISPECIES: BTAD domain-containing putative transcriptional regulator [unclassified Pseudofrankia]MDT3442505.1 BTAD domain-containing putative transcriptional regulator [Pseudofrankia sp. BMG5.37]OHV74706.1 transcriptional regulator [Pseudofrankia sp. BMG5.36]
MPGLEFRLLGRVEVYRDGQPVDVGGPKQRAVLASLLLRVRRVVSVDQLIDDLWPEQPPARAAATVQVFVSQLRRALEPERSRGRAATVLVTASPGYLLDVEPDAVDAHAFADLVVRGREALDAGDPERAARSLLRAEAMLRGPALVDVPVTPFVRAAAARLTELHLGAVEDRIDAELSLGRHAALVAELEQRVRRHPLRERLRAQLMLGLYRCGRQVEALATYRETRRVLHDELGLEPGVRLRELEQAVLRQDPVLAWQPPTPPAVPVVTAEVATPDHEPPSADRPGRVLVVDDTAINRKLLAAAVAGLGHEVETAENGHRALEILRAADDGPRGFDIVLLDLLMPVLDGYATLAEIKADPVLAAVPVIMVSAVPELESVVRCIELGAIDYLPKPYSSTMLRARLRASLQARRSAAERETALRTEIAALRAEVSRGRIGSGLEHP